MYYLSFEQFGDQPEGGHSDVSDRQMTGRLAGRVAVVVGAGQTPGATVGNGRAAALLYAREGARVVAADLDPASAEQTVQEIEKAGGTGIAVRADVSDEADIEAMIRVCRSEYGRIDVLHNNVGVSFAAGDAAVDVVEAEAFGRVLAINLGGMVLTCKHVLPTMREQGAGVITNISSIAAHINHPTVGYRTSKAGVVTLTEHVAVTNARHGIRANVILPGLMDTPMAVERRIGENGATREEIVAKRQGSIPLGRTGTGWDVANAALFLASDEAAFITGASLTIDGGQSLLVG